MDLGKMLAEAIDSALGIDGFSDEHFQFGEMSAAAEAFLAKVREAGGYQRYSFDSVEFRIESQGFSHEIISHAEGHEYGIRGRVSEPGFALCNQFFAERQIAPESLVGATINYGEESFTILSVTSDGEDTHRIVMQPREPDHTGPVPHLGKVE